MKRKIQIFALLTVLCTQACQQFLTEEPASALNPVTYYVDEAALNSGVYAAYANLRAIYGQDESPFRLTILGTDLFTNGKNQSGLPFDNYSPDLNSFAPEVGYLWNNCYKTINLCNTITVSAPEVSMNEVARARVMAEARFIRALCYFWLVQSFGDIPLPLQPTAGVQREVTRVSREEVYEVILEDLRYAEANLESTYPQWGRIRKGAVQHLLSKVHLVLEDWSAAANYAKQVIADEANYVLLSDFSRVFHYENQENKEIIFSVQYEYDPINSGSGNLTHVYFTNSYSDIPGLMRALQWGRPFTRYAPTPYLMGLFDDEKDARTDIWRTFDDYYYNDPNNLPPGKNLGDPLDPSLRERPEFHPALIKYWDPTRPTVNELRGNKDFIVFRLAETYLIAAEALMMQGDRVEAASFFNEVRRRAQRPGYDLTVAADELSIDLILEERGRELAGEMHRWFDLIRTGKALARIKAHSVRGQGIQPFHLLRPIPQAEIDRASNEVVQNTGY